MAGSTASAFADNFMRGFAFVDRIKANNRAERRLEQRLREEREDRSFQRQRQIEADQNVREDRRFQREERDRLRKARADREAGISAALDANSTNEELAALAPNSPEAAAELQRRTGQARLTDALSAVQTIGQAPAQAPGIDAGPSNLVTAQPSAESPSDPAPAATFADAGELAFAPSRGTGGQRRVTEEEINAFDPEFQEKGLLARAGDVVAGQAAQTARAARSAALKSRGIVDPTGPNSVGANFTGDVFVDDQRWTDAEEFAQMSQEEVAAARAQNQQIVAELKDAGMSAGGLDLGRQSQILAGSDLARSEAAKQDAAVTKLYSEFADPTVESRLDTLAAEDPVAATALYMQTRATAATAAPGAVEEADRRMVGVMQNAANELQSIAINQPDTPEGKRAQRRLTELNRSTGIIAKQQRPVAQQAGINSQGLKVGDQQRADQVMQVITDPNRPTPVTHTPGAQNAALQAVSRITPNKRLNSRQIQGLATLVESGWMNGKDAMAVMMTGQMPGNSVGIEALHNFDGQVWARYSNGQVAVLRDSKPRPNQGEVPNREIGDDQMKWLVEGGNTVFGDMTPEQSGRLQGLALDNAGWMRQHFNMTSQEQVRTAGRIFSQSILLSAKEFQRREDSWFASTKNTPTPEEIFLNEGLRTELANEFQVQLVPMPAVQASSDIDFEPIRGMMREGRFGPGLVDAEAGMSDQEVAYVYWVHNATPEQIAAAQNAQE